MEINEYRPKHSRLHKVAASEYEASRVKAQHIKSSGQEQNSLHISKNEHTLVKGEIIDLRYQEVKIRLEPSGQIINAKLSGEVPLSIGQTAEFMVSDETDGQITLRYIRTGSYPMNDIIHKALYSSGLTASQRNLTIVQELLNYQMPVDKNTILQLIKLTSAYPDVSPATLILMHKNSLPINMGSIAQFEAYQNGMHQILSQLKSLIGNIDSLVADNSLIVSNYNSSDIIMVNNGIASEEAIPTNALDDNVINLPNSQSNISSANVPLGNNLSDSIHISSVIYLHKQLLTILQDGEDIELQKSPDASIGYPLSDSELIRLRDTLIGKINESSYYGGEIAENIKSQLSDSTATLESLLSILHDLYSRESTQPLIESKILQTNVVDIFISMSEQLSENDRKKLVHLLKSTAYRETITKALHNKWTMNPTELTQENKVKDFFRRLDKDMEQLDKLTDNFKMSHSPDFKSSVNKLQDNLQFMRDLNDLFLYLQLPIRLTGQDVHGDLYVFTRKNQKHSDTEGLNVLLHLEMTNLGSMDIHISMRNRQVNAVFYVEKSAEQIISKHLHKLIDTLTDKGYQVQAKTQISNSQPDFITDILQQNAPSSNTHRYTFDIRA